MITKDPFDNENKGAVYLSAVCGHGSPVTDNTGIPEQVLFNPRTKATILMTLSDQKNALRFDPDGGLKEVPDKCANPNTKRVLNDAQVRSLATVATNIKRVFGNKAEQDIEWGILQGKIYIVQSRPYISK
jgi:pyruvate,water dikinase